jgi:hypothetical protein
LEYFKEIALGMEFGYASEVTSKWNSDMTVFVNGNPINEVLNELERIKNEINGLATDGFQIEVVNSQDQSNFYVYFGDGDEYARMFPSEANLVNSNLGLFHINWTNQDYIYSGHMYVNTTVTNSIQQKHLLREELTQSLGLAKDSPKYPDSIFQSEWTETNSYADIDKELIKLLYHPSMVSGLNANEVESVMVDIFSNN